jgi:hypothetical protein
MVMPDSRMRWILNIEEIETRRWHWMEYEIASEGFVDGLFQNENGSILCGALDFAPDQHGLYYYLLKIKTAEWTNPKEVTKKGYAFPDGIIGELLALFSLYFRRRFYLVSSCFGELTDHSLKLRNILPFIRVPCPVSLHPQVFSKQRQSWSGPVNGFLHSVKNLDPTYHPQYILAVNHYARALREIGVDQEMVFIRLVSSIETLSTTSVALAKTKDALADVDIDSLFRDDLSSDIRREVKSVIDARKARAKYVKFIEDYSGNGSTLPDSGTLVKIGVKDLRKRLQAIYDARSDYLHSGIPMYLSRPSAAFPAWDMEPSLGQIIDRRFFPESKKLPNAWWFDGIVRNCLLRFLDKHGKIGDNNCT